MATQTRTRRLFNHSSKSNTAAVGVTGGTLGGAAGHRAAGKSPGHRLAVGDEGYLWLLIAIEVILLGILRKQFRRHHGG